jgi:hypothetical protein
MDSLPNIPDIVKVRGRDIAKINEAHNADRINSVTGASIYGGRNGVTIALPRALKPRNIVIRHPWFLTGTIEAGPVAKIYIKPGMVNNFVPTIDMSGTPTSLAAFPAPSITVTGTTGIIELKATIDGAGTITALIAQNVTTASTDTSTNKYKTVGTWTSASGAFTSVTSILNTNQTFRVCNGTAEWY